MSGSGSSPWLFRLPWFRRFDGYAAHWTILLRSRALLADDDLVTHELCHVWQMQHHPLRMPLSYLLARLRGQRVRTGGAILGGLLTLYLRLARLPRLGPVELDAETEARFERSQPS